MKIGPELDRDDGFLRLVTVQKGPPRIADRAGSIFHLDLSDEGAPRRREDIRRLSRDAAAGSRGDPVALQAGRLRVQDRRRRLGRHVLRDRAVHVRRREPIFLQIKQAKNPYRTSRRPPHGHRIRVGAWSRGSTSCRRPARVSRWVDDPAGGRQFYVRQLKNRHLGEVAELLEGEALPAYARSAAARWRAPMRVQAIRPLISGLPRKRRGVRRCDGFVRHALCEADEEGSRRRRSRPRRRNRRKRRSVLGALDVAAVFGLDDHARVPVWMWRHHDLGAVRQDRRLANDEDAVWFLIAGSVSVISSVTRAATGSPLALPLNIDRMTFMPSSSHTAWSPIVSLVTITCSKFSSFMNV